MSPPIKAMKKFFTVEYKKKYGTASQKDMAKSRIPLEYRDYCAQLLIPLNKCRGETFYLPWKCGNERHAYEKCQYEDFKRRMKEQQAKALEE